MFKRDIIKKLHAYGIRKAEKVGVGSVSLAHLKNSDLCALLEKVEENSENSKR